MIHWDRAYQYVCAAFAHMNIPWFFCFGSMLHITRSTIAEHCFKIPQEKFWKKMMEDDDIDIGVFYDSYEPIYIENFATACGWKISNKIVPDTGGKPFYISMKPSDDVKVLTGSVEVDVFAWYLHEGIYWHTYDLHFERPKKGVPKNYTFKGVPAKWLKNFIARDNIGNSRLCGKVPADYGTLLDLWYGDWLQKRQMVSETRWLIKMKSCKSFEKKDYEIINWDKDY